MHLGICDDKAGERSQLAALLEDYGRLHSCAITYEMFDNAIELLEAAGQRSFDLLLLDILMPGITGMEAAKEIRRADQATPIIFLTSSQEFAVESYRVRAEDYIMKPARAADVFPALDRQLAKLSQAGAYLTLKSADLVIKLPLSEISYVEVMNRMVRFALVNGEVKEVYGYLVDFEHDLLASSDFLKTHRSYIVNMSQMSTLGKTGFLTRNGSSVPVARGLLPQVKAAYLKHLLAGKGDL